MQIYSYSATKTQYDVNSVNVCTLYWDQKFYYKIKILSLKYSLWLILKVHAVLLKPSKIYYIFHKFFWYLWQCKKIDSKLNEKWFVKCICDKLHVQSMLYYVIFIVHRCQNLFCHANIKIELDQGTCTCILTNMYKYM